jgi:hypothetical protein
MFEIVFGRRITTPLCDEKYEHGAGGSELKRLVL